MRRYSPEEKAHAVRLVRKLREELGAEHGTVQPLARQLGFGAESVRVWVRRAATDEGRNPGVPTAYAERMKALEQEDRELCLGRHIKLALQFAYLLEKPVWLEVVAEDTGVVGLGPVVEAVPVPVGDHARAP